MCVTFDAKDGNVTVIHPTFFDFDSSERFLFYNTLREALVGLTNDSTVKEVMGRLAFFPMGYVYANGEEESLVELEVDHLTMDGMFNFSIEDCLNFEHSEDISNLDEVKDCPSEMFETVDDSNYARLKDFFDNMGEWYILDEFDNYLHKA